MRGRNAIEASLARTALIFANGNLVYSIANGYRVGGWTIDDLVQEGTIGLYPCRGQVRLPPGTPVLDHGNPLD